MPTLSVARGRRDGDSLTAGYKFSRGAGKPSAAARLLFLLLRLQLIDLGLLLGELGAHLRRLRRLLVGLLVVL